MKLPARIKALQERIRKSRSSSPAPLTEARVREIAAEEASRAVRGLRIERSNNR